MTVHELIAGKMDQADRVARDALLLVALANIDRRLDNQALSAPSEFIRWRVLLENALQDDAAFQRVHHLLRLDSEMTQQ